jgi:S1-C subfamily serine protease
MGNSGGALVDARGRLVGINTAIVSTTRGNIGIGFAIPVNLASSIMYSLIETGTVARGFLGVSGDTLDPDLAEASGLARDVRGVVINNVTAGSPADQAGLRRGDVILAINDRVIASLQDLRLFVSQIAPGTEVSVRTSRDGRERIVRVALGRLQGSEDPNRLLEGVTVAPVDDEARRELRLDERVGGLVVREVEANSPYAERLLPNMVIVEINRVAVTDAESAREALVPGRNLLLVYYRGAYRYLAITVRR